GRPGQNPRGRWRPWFSGVSLLSVPLVRPMTDRTRRGPALRDELSFLLTNRVPRVPLTRWMARFSQIENPRIPWLSIRLWRLLARDLDLGEARKERFRSLHDCFIRELRPGARTVDPDPQALTSPCDGIVGAAGRILGQELLQAKGHAYQL